MESSDALMSAALLDADKEIESLCSDPQQQSWIRSQENSVESLGALQQRQANGGAIGGLLGFSQSQYGGASIGQLSPGRYTFWYLLLTSILLILFNCLRTFLFTYSLAHSLAHLHLYLPLPFFTYPGSQMSLTGGMGLASSMSFGDDIDDALPNSARSRPGDTTPLASATIYYPLSIFMCSYLIHPHSLHPFLTSSPYHTLSQITFIAPASIERDSRSTRDQAETKGVDDSLATNATHKETSDDKEQQQGEDEGKGEGKDNDNKSTDKEEKERKLVAPIDSFFVSHN